MCRRAGLLVGWQADQRRALVARANCDSWNCDDCSKRMSETWGLRAHMGAREILGRGDTLDFVTITSHERLRDFASCEHVWRNAWGKLYNALKRQKDDLSYMIVPEKHKDGRMHVHCLWNAGVSQKWLKDNARKRGLGYQCKISHILSGGSAQQYVIKYIGKDLGTDVPHRFRRVRVSNNWADIPAPVTEFTGVKWEYIGSNGALSIVYEECQAKHITLIDVKTGEVFDDVDLGTIVSYA